MKDPSKEAKIKLQLKSLESKDKDLDKKKEELEETIKLGLENHAGFVDEVGNKLVSWIQQSRNSVDVSSLKINVPDIYNKFLKNSTTRVFRLKEM